MGAKQGITKHAAGCGRWKVLNSYGCTGADGTCHGRLTAREVRGRLNPNLSSQD